MTQEEFIKAFEKAERMFDTSNVAPSIWCNGCYPTTIIKDRYDGTYSDGRWLAFPCLFDKVPPEIEGQDPECRRFWDNYKGIVGKGKTPQEAFDNLKDLMFSKNNYGKQNNSIQ